MRTQAWKPPPAAGPALSVVVTQRQAQMLDGLFHGLTGEQIGRALGISRYTVNSHIRRLCRLVGANSREHLVGLAVSGQVRVEVMVDRYKAETRAAL